MVTTVWNDQSTSREREQKKTKHVSKAGTDVKDPIEQWDDGLKAWHSQWKRKWSRHAESNGYEDAKKKNDGFLNKLTWPNHGESESSCFGGKSRVVCTNVARCILILFVFDSAVSDISTPLPATLTPENQDAQHTQCGRQCRSLSSMTKWQNWRPHVRPQCLSTCRKHELVQLTAVWSLLSWVAGYLSGDIKVQRS